jgi:hypothetical protein
MNHKLCKRCGAVKPASEFGSNAGRHDGLQVYCKPCWTEYRNGRKAETKASQRRWYATHRDEHLEQKAEYYRENREAIRPKRWKVNRDPDEYARHVADMKARSRVYRAKVFAHYGTSCECCGESNPGFLTIDHINGCTKEERKKQGGGSGRDAGQDREGDRERHLRHAGVGGGRGRGCAAGDRRGRGPGGVPADEGGAPTYVQLTDRDALAGKTLERVEALWQKLFFVFADGTFVAVGIERDRHEYDNVSLTLDVPVDFDDRVTLGLPDAGDSREAIERHKEAKRREEEVMAARLRKMDEEIAIAVEATQRAEYERLKAKFEGAV